MDKVVPFEVCILSNNAIENDIKINFVNKSAKNEFAISENNELIDILKNVYLKDNNNLEMKNKISKNA